MLINRWICVKCVTFYGAHRALTDHLEKHGFVFYPIRMSAGKDDIRGVVQLTHAW
jgi:hypothetical protein